MKNNSMPFIGNKLDNNFAAPVLLVFIILGSLIYSNYFIYTSLFNYYGFTLGAAVLALLTSYFNIVNNQSRRLFYIIPALLFAVWCVFPLFISSSFQQSFYRIAALFIFIGALLLINKKNITFLFIVILLLASIEGIICLLQFFKLIPSASVYFTVTGSFSNPNVIAMFLAMCVPIACYFCFISTGISRKLIILSLILIVIALFLLRCRSAMIGTCAATTFFLVPHFNLLKRYKISHLLLTVILLIGLLIPIAKYMYFQKQDSADGRMLVWKISGQLFKESLWKGYGAGMFEKTYNLKQAEYIANGRLTEKELEHAGFVRMAYNDFLEQGIEGGIVLLMLFTGLLFSLLFIPVWKPEIENRNKTDDTIPISAYYACYAGILGFALMAIFNFVIQAIPVFCLFCIYAGILCGFRSRKETGTKKLNLSNCILSGFLLMAGVFILFWQIQQAKAHRQNKQASILLSENKIAAAIDLLAPLNKELNQSETYHYNYGNALFTQQLYSKALSQYEIGKQLSSDPKFYEAAGSCHVKLNHTKEALNNYEQASLLSPKTIRYKYITMKLQVANGEIAAACKTAIAITTQKAIHADKRIKKYQYAAKQLLLKENYPTERKDKINESLPPIYQNN